MPKLSTALGQFIFAVPSEDDATIWPEEEEECDGDKLALIGHLISEYRKETKFVIVWGSVTCVEYKLGRDCGWIRKREN